MLSLERVIKSLISLGLSRIDAETYVYLAKKGSQTISDLTNDLKYSRQKIFVSLKTLTNKGLMTKRDSMFVALPFEEALELLIKQEKEHAKLLSDNKKDLVTNWNSNS